MEKKSTRVLGSNKKTIWNVKISHMENTLLAGQGEEYFILET